MFHPFTSSMFFKQLLFSVSSLFFLVGVTAQTDFNHYQTLMAKGEIPVDFVTDTKSKITTDMLSQDLGVTPTKERIFFEGINVTIDELLHSGLVVYGDEVSMYVTKIADRLLEKQPELKAKLRFYTVKSTEANALSTHQGIIFVTTGLIAQLTSEAQLALVLAHEISHYSEQHVLESFDWNAKNGRKKNSYELRCQFSKENELIADKLGLTLYQNAGYTKEEVVSTFDVLMYSYLPFDEVQVPTTYFSNSRMYIPQNQFPVKEYPITAEEDYNDQYSSHPNIKKRKDAILEAIEELDDWGKVVFSQGESVFYQIRSTCRFETVRSYVLNGEYAQALYSIFILEKEYPSSIYLHRTKAICWLGFAQYEMGTNESKRIPKKADFEGESATMFSFLGRLSDEALLAMAARTIYDIDSIMPNDDVIVQIKDRIALTMAYTTKFSVDDYAKRGYLESVAFAKAKQESNQADTVEKTSSKYDKIKTKRKVDVELDIDSTKFFRYGIADIITDSVFLTKYQYYKQLKATNDAKEDSLEALTNQKGKKAELFFANTSGIDSDNLLVVQPGAVYVDKNDQTHWDKEKITADYAQSGLDIAATENGFNQKTINQQSLETQGTSAFNELNLLYGLIEQKAALSDNDVFFPVDYEQLKELETKYETTNVVFTSVNYQRTREVNGAIMLVGTIFWPMIPITYFIYLPIKLHQSNNLRTSLIVLDITTGDIKSALVMRKHKMPSKAAFEKIYSDMYGVLRLTKR